MNFFGKIILITGGSSGIGAGAAIHLAKLGGQIALVGRNEERLNEVARQIASDTSRKPLIIVADVTKDAQRIVDETVDHYSRLDVLINNAGIVSEETIETITMDAFDKMIDVNVRSIIKITQLAIPFLKQSHGNIVNVSSTAGLKAVPNLLSYCISKSALDQFTKCCALDLAGKVRVNSINPAAIRTPLYKTLGIDSTAENELFETYKSRYPVGRIGEVSDTSAAIAYLASDSASFITGTCLAVDGGAIVAGFD